MDKQSKHSSLWKQQENHPEEVTATGLLLQGKPPLRQHFALVKLLFNPFSFLPLIGQNQFSLRLWNLTREHAQQIYIY